MKLVDTIKDLFAKLNKYKKAAQDIEKKISETLHGKEEEEDDDEEEEEEEEAPKPIKKKKSAKKKKHGSK